MPNVIWTQSEKQIRDNTAKDFLEILPSKGLTYRDNQYTYARAILEAILNNNILLIEAGVGTGKSIGYLVPIFETLNGKSSVKSILISTSSRALQKQLQEDIKKVSEMLEISNMPVVVSKGIGNYACFKKLVDLIRKVREKKSEAINDVTALQEMRTILSKSDSYEIDVLNTKLKNPFWNKIALTSTSQCDSNKCPYYQACKFIEEQAKLRSPGPKIIITNHAKLTTLIKDGTLDEVGTVVIDEAHDLPQQMKLALTRTISLSELDDVIYRGFASSKIFMLLPNDEEELQRLRSELMLKFESFKTKLKSNSHNISKKVIARGNIKEENLANKDINTGGEYLNSTICDLAKCFSELVNFISMIKKKYRQEISELEKDFNYLESCYEVLMDMQKGDESANIYWLTKNEQTAHQKASSTSSILDFSIAYKPKTVDNLFRRLNKNRAVVYTSGTLAPYESLISEMGEVPSSRLRQSQPIPTTYPFNDCLFYYDPEMPQYDDPQHERYINAMAIKVRDLIIATNGKALVLFTSKEEMKEVYEKVNELGMPEGLDLMLQDDANTADCINKFKSNINSCLFATGAFWQGVDFEGITLSNLIITRLPFPVKDAEIRYKINMINKKEKLSKGEKKRMLNIMNYNRMLLQFRQGVGRGKRNESDHVLFSCLDSRFAKYKSRISQYLPTDLNYTTSMEDVVEYSNNYILNSEKKLA